jgi:flagella basal body P-ring formation protein FlgA
LIAAASLVAPIGAEAGDVRIWPTAVVDGETILLSDVAELRDLANEDRQRLGSLPVGTAPRPGGEILIHNRDVRGALQDAGADLAALKLLGAAGCRVSRPALPIKPKPVAPRQTSRPTPIRPHANNRAVARLISDTRPLDAANLEKLIRDYITARVSVRDAKLDIRFSPACESALQTEQAGHRFYIKSRDERRTGLMTLEVEISSDDEAPRTVPIVAEVAIVKEVLVAKRPINRGQTIGARDLGLESRRFSEVATIGLTDLSAAVGQQARRLLRTGDMLGPRDLDSRPLVQRGQPVTIWVKRGDLVIKSAGRAQQAGSLGETIEVARDGSRKKTDLIEAVVTGPGTVSRGDVTQVASGVEAP